MLSTRRYLIQLLLLYSLILICLFLGYRLLLDYPQELSAAEAHQKRELESLSRGLQMGLRNLQAVTTDWAHWDDTLAFVKDPDNHQDYVEGNILSSTFETFELLGIVYFDRNFDLVMAQGYDLQVGEYVSIEQVVDFRLSTLFKEQIKPGEPWQSSGWLASRQGAAAFAIQYISDSAQEHPPAGYLLFIQSISQNQIANLEATTRLKLNFTPTSLADPVTHGVVSLMTPELVEGYKLERRRLLDDFTGTPIMLLSITHEPLTDMQPIGWSEVLILSSMILAPIVLALAVDRRLLKPLRHNTRLIETMVERQTLEPLSQRLHTRELEQIRQAFNRSVDLVERQQAVLRGQSMTDALTGLANRRAFDQQGAEMWNLAVRQQESFTLALMDLDHFKAFNDNLGHLAGDEALRKIGRSLTKSCRRANELVARIGGEEFVLIMMGLEEQTARQRMEALRTDISELGIAHPQSSVSMSLTCSLGTIHVPRPGINYRAVRIEDLLSMADKELYRAKDGGRNQVSFHVYQLPQAGPDAKSAKENLPED
ncbi:sensor domain-containing diguanylate cyclase [Bowmanella dokdonensis]|uniref:diguanylate cyclase n=1 Tax=Bowmanella dokdonensis TaxID=751969 RepID=A0A939DPK0_9ALTE|nr:diguanylate cyclase [Bowmanella dokdonensis]MBN7826609.1 diguanylate cyclase [Bowmanella dokdonensis]